MSEQALVYDVESLAEALGLTVSTVRKYMATAPEKLPPRLNLPFKKKALWSKKEVAEWVEFHRDTPPDDAYH